MKKIKQDQFRLKIFASLFWVLGIMLCGSPTSLYAADPIPNLGLQQTKTITGTVVSSDDSMPIPGVSVILKGTSIGVATDFDGNYSIKVPSNEAVLVFSYLGYASQEITVGTKTNVNVSLKPDATTLDEIVVVGYGTQKKAVITGSIDVVKSEVFENRAVTNPVLALQGSTPGLIVSRSSSRPGEQDAGFLIRGSTSVNGGSALIVVDGIPGADFNQINPDDIESISILKDASAAIYGSRGANGVVLVTTKKGKGKMSIEINSQVRINTIGIKPQSTSAKEYFDVYIDAMESDDAVMGDFTANPFGWISIDNAKSIRDMLAAGEEGYVNSFWGAPANNPTDLYITNNNIWDQVYGTSISNQHNLSISGSTDKISYRLSGMYLEDVGAVTATYDGEVQYNFRSVVNVQVSDRLNIGTNLALTQLKRSQPSAGLTGSVFTNDPAIYPTVNPYGQWVSNFNYSGGARQPLANLVDGGRNFEERDRHSFVFDATYKITDHLDFKASAAFKTTSLAQNTYVLEVPIYTFDGIKQVNTVNQGSSSFYTNHGTGRTDTYGAYLNYKNTFNEDHNIGFTTGINTEASRTKSVNAFRQGFEDQGVYDITSASDEILVENGGSNSHEGLYGVLANLTYDYQEKYLVQAAFRRDGSSRFAPEERWDNFLSGSLGWIITKEKFMENLGFLNYLKVRTSYGETANGFPNNGPLQLYDYISGVTEGNTLFGSTPSLQTTGYLSRLTSRDRNWERVVQSNIGLDFRALNSRLSGSFDVYKKQNVGMFINVLFPSQLGGTAPLSNGGDFESTGWEASLTWQDNVNDNFKYSVNAFVSDNNSLVVNKGGIETPSNGYNTSLQGYSLNSLWVYKTDGLFQTQEEVDQYYAAHTEILNSSNASMADGGNTTKLTPGDVRKVDVNEDGRIDSNDLVHVGNGQTHYNFGLNLSASYKGFDFGALFQGVGKQDILRTGVFAYPIVGRFSNQTDQFLGETWTPTNTDASLPRTTTHTTRSNWNWAYNDFRVQNNRYVRLKTLTVGYTLPKIKLGETEFNKIRVYFSGNDLWEHTSLDDGYDPEYGFETEKTYPYARSWAFGVNVNF
ncbi:SusC/RagA family TonB-linked outer membrane protein [Polaribacter sp. Hel1_85]|uniref:SusC/RagA family TonB-linked outer membrane protein n=1 Tax=Polaribacter sp. Hel1_85 TaxID=1250005 RepID=UPI00052DB9CC|nr:TonB-dependent receptor [Polaribacter sp. Hel1_85]KGL62286.1 TonB-dependent receptor, plug [Polaribacter sp. Hel1_85]